MSEPLIIWLPEDLDDAWAYYKAEEGGAEQGWAADIEDRKKLSRLDRGETVIVCPGTWFRTFPHSLPEMKSSERISAAGYAIEEKLAAPLDEQHIILGKVDDQRVGVVNRELLGAIMTRLDNLDIVPRHLISEYEAFGADKGTLSAWGRTIHPGPMGYALDAEAEGENPLSLMPGMDFASALNYAQGGFARRKAARFSTRQLATMAAVCVLTFTGWLGWQWSEARALQQQAADVRAEAGRLYTEATGRKAPPNLTRTVERQIKSGGETQADFVSLSALFFDGLKTIDNLSIETLRYNEARGSLTVKMIYPSFETAAQLEQVFAGGAGVFKSGSVRDQKGQLIGEGEFSFGGAR